MNAFHYVGGELVCQGDKVMVVDKRAIIERVLQKYSQDAQDYACFETGGLLLKFDDGDLQVWPYVNEDLRFLQRDDCGT